MSFERFISSRLIRQKNLGSQVSRPVLRIAIASIALAILVNSLTLAVVRGFQKQIKDKITGFNAPLFISKAGSSHIFEAEPIDRRISFLKELDQIAGVQSVEAVSFKPVLLQSKRFNDTLKLNRGSDTVIARQDLLGLMIKGVEPSYNWDFIEANLASGRLIHVDSINEVLISSEVSKKLNISLNDEVSCYHIKQKPLLKKVKVVGIYNTGFVEYDQKLIFGNLQLVQQMSDNGTQISLRPEFSSSSALIKIEVKGQATELLYDWGLGPDIYTAHRFTDLKDTTLKVVAYHISESNEKLEFVDSASLRISVPNGFSYSNMLFNDQRAICLVDGLDHQVFETRSGDLRLDYKDGIGTGANFVSGFEVSISNFDSLEIIQNAIRDVVEMRPVNQHLLQVTSIKSTESDLFSWLHFIDFNVLVIIFLMLVIGIINIGSALLVLIVVRTSFVGLLKALGANNKSIRKIFLYQAAYLIIRGLIIGNILAIALCYLQQNFALIKLNAAVYYLDSVPIELNFWNILLVNVLTFVTCMISLLIPSRVVSRITPIKSIKFQ